MKIETTRKLKINIDSIVRLVEQGETIDLSEDRADRARPYIERGLLRIVKDILPGLVEGVVTEWRSPIFGTLRGKVEMVEPGNGRVTVDHPLTGELASIPIEWIIRIGNE